MFFGEKTNQGVQNVDYRAIAADDNYPARRKVLRLGEG
jgi:hypothetical protein